MINVPWITPLCPKVTLSENGRRYASGWVMRAGCTRRSKSLAETKPSRTASSRKVVPFLCAVLAICAALS